MSDCENIKRIPNFSPGEKQSLMRIISKHANIIEDKKTNKVSNEEKSQAWKRIREEFNSTAPILCYRTIEQLKRLYENKKKDLRKKLSENKQQIYLTGGGPPHEEVKLDEIEKIIVQIINEKTVYGTPSQFDCDEVGPPPKNKKQEYEEFELLHSGVENEIFDVPDCEEFLIPAKLTQSYSATQSTILQHPINDKLNVDNTPAKPTQRCPPTGLQGPINDKLQVDISSQIGNQRTKKNSAAVVNNKPSSSSTTPKTPIMSKRRRPMGQVRVLTSSDVAEKYNLLLDKRLVLLEKQVEQIVELKNFSNEEQKIKINILKQQQENVCLEKDEKLLKIDLLKAELRYKKSLLSTNM